MILDQFGKPLQLESRQMERVAKVRAFYENKLRSMKSSYDATRDGPSFATHWSNADHRSPDGASSAAVRKTLRSRSRFEVIENNPYLAGMVLTLANDFTGSGPKTQITDKRLSKATQRFIELEYDDWKKETRYRPKLWRQRVAKCTDGEAFKRMYLSDKLATPVKLNVQVVEADQCMSDGVPDAKQLQITEVDGIRFDRNKEPTDYFLLDEHPGASIFIGTALSGRWYRSNVVTHWFRQTRGWNRGIPETAPSLPLCALLRRYTLAAVKAAETNSSMTAILESQMPSAEGAFGGDDTDDVFDTIPIEHDMFTVLPWGYKFGQFNQGQPTIAYDPFVNSVLREIARPLLVPYNIAAGSSKDSNMATAVVDTHIYKEGGKAERLSCGEMVLDPDFAQWWAYARLIPRYLPQDALALGPIVPRHRDRWDRIGLDHTDPAKVAQALKIAHEAGHITDRDIQEGYYNRSVEDWQEDVTEQNEFRDEIGMPIGSVAAIQMQQQQLLMQQQQNSADNDGGDDDEGD
jgi:capsid protein